MLGRRDVLAGKSTCYQGRNPGSIPGTNMKVGENPFYKAVL